MDKPILACSYKRILHGSECHEIFFSNEKEGGPAIYNTVDGS